MPLRWSFLVMFLSTLLPGVVFCSPRVSLGQGIITTLPAASREAGIVASSKSVLAEAVSSPDKGVPRSMLRKAEAVVIVPRLLKIGVIAGVRHGQGVLLVKDAQGVWQLPQFITLTGGSVGWQAGIVSSDLVLVFTNRRRVEQLLRSGRFTIGVDAAAAAGPVGRTVSAGTDGKLSAEIYSYARSRGLFAGVSVDGAVIQIDQMANRRFYPGGTVPASALQLTNYVAQLTGGKAGFPANATTPTAPATTAPTLPAVPTAPPVGTQVASSTAQRLAELHRQLDRLLDPAWRRYLSLPTMVNPPVDATGTLQALQQTLARYDRVAADSRYAVLTRRTEFRQVHAALKAYVASLQARTLQPLQLPPPPASQP